MKNITLILIFTCSGLPELKAQEVREFFLNRYFEVTEEQKEAYFIRLAKPQNGYWAYTDYDGKNNVVQVGYFTDSTFSKPIGPYRFEWNGKLLYRGNYVNGKPSGFWYFFNDKGDIIDSLHYMVTESEPQKIPAAENREEEKKKSEALLKEHEKKDTSKTFATVEHEASFPGGDKAWAKHISRQLDIPDLVMALNRPSKLTVTVQFIVCKDGEVCSVEALNSSTPLLDRMAINAIRNGPHWNPAVQSGRNVKAWRRQKISFIIPE